MLEFSLKSLKTPKSPEGDFFKLLIFNREKRIIKGLKARHVLSIWIMRRGTVAGNYVTLFQSFCYNVGNSITGFRCASPCAFT